MEPLITIGITCFNAEATIARAIDSARKQDWKRVEIIVVDDASTDRSLEIIEGMQRKDPRVRLYRHEENRGYPAALNTVIEHALGAYIAFFDDDDDSVRERLSKQYARLSQFDCMGSGAPVLCYTHRRVFVDGEEKPEGFVHAIGATCPEPRGAMVADFLLWHRQKKGYSWGEFGSCTMMASRAVLNAFNFDENFRRKAEWDLAIRVAFEGGYFIAVDEPLVLQHKTQTSDKAGRKPLDYALRLRKKHQAYLKRKQVYWGALLLAYTRFYSFRGKLWRSRVCLALSCLLSPMRIFLSEVSKRLE